MWIKTVDYGDADGRLRKIYDDIKGPEDQVDNVMRVHSLRPHTMEGHLSLYRSVLHHSANQLPSWFMEMIGVFVSHLNRCTYCLEHHFAGFAKALGDADKAAAMRDALETYDLDQLDEYFDDRERLAIDYVRKLTDTPMTLRQQDIDDLRTVGWSDGEILEINQITAYFAFANRTVQGLGVTTEGET